MDDAHQQRHHTAYEFVALEIADLLEQHATTEMIVSVGVTARTSQRTFPGDLDREKRRTSSEDSLPPAQYLGSVDHFEINYTMAARLCLCLFILDGTSSLQETLHANNASRGFTRRRDES